MYLKHRNLGNKYKGRRRSRSIQPSRRHHSGCTDSTSLERTKLLHISRQTITYKRTILVTDSIAQRKRQQSPTWADTNSRTPRRRTAPSNVMTREVSNSNKQPPSWPGEKGKRCTEYACMKTESLLENFFLRKTNRRLRPQGHPRDHQLFPPSDPLFQRPLLPLPHVPPHDRPDGLL